MSVEQPWGHRYAPLLLFIVFVIIKFLLPPQSLTALRGQIRGLLADYPVVTLTDADDIGLIPKKERYYEFVALSYHIDNTPYFSLTLHRAEALTEDKLRNLQVGDNLQTEINWCLDISLLKNHLRDGPPLPVLPLTISKATTGDGYDLYIDNKPYRQSVVCPGGGPAAASNGAPMMPSLIGPAFAQRTSQSETSDKPAPRRPKFGRRGHAD